MSATLADVRAALDGAVWDGRGVGAGEVVVTDATHDSRQVEAGSLFCAVRGQREDGHDHAAAAVEAGATALLVERWLDLPAPQLRVVSVREAIGPAAAVVHGRPSERLTVIGVTGTNGKTTTAYLLEGAAGAAARGTGLIGTVETRIHGRAQPGARTTPEGTDLQRLLARMRTRGVDVVAMEVSSHGLALHRVDGTRFAVALFTNLTRDHLDFHGSMEAYHRAKARLFTPALSERGVVCVEDEAGRRIAREAEIPVVTFGRTAEADCRLTDVVSGVDGGRGRLAAAGGLRVTTRLPGTFNVVNAAGAVLAAQQAGLDVRDAAAGVAACEGVPGRFERVRTGVPGPAVFVDYAHTPDALEAVLGTARELAGDHRVAVVVGCGGDRDRGKRPRMGAVAARADLAVLTSDNPRGEDPDDILAAVEEGAREALAHGRGAAELVIETDRRSAIAAALSHVTTGDVVVIAGKGHETGQQIGDRTVPFDDRRVAAEVLTEGLGGAA